MPDKNPNQYPWEVLAPAWVYFIAMLAGFVAFFEKLSEEIKGGTAISWRLKLLGFITQVFSSGLAAVLTYQVLDAPGTPEKWMLPLVGIGAHMGTEALKLLGEIWKRKIGITPNQNDEVKKE